MRLAAITGASGFLGRHLVRAFADAGWAVRVLMRRDPIHEAWRGIEPQVIPGDLNDDMALARLCDGADAVVHSAGLVKARSRAEFFAVNAEGAGRMAQAAARASVGRFVLVSSLAAREPEISPYAASKRAGEAACAEALTDRLVIARPPAIYGPGDLETAKLFVTAQRSPWLPLFDPQSRLALIHVEDAAAQIQALAAGDGCAGRTAALSDDRPQGYSWREIMQSAADAVGKSPRFVRIPDAAMVLLGLLGDAKSRMGQASILGGGKVRELLHQNWSIAADEQIERLPAVRRGMREGFAQTVTWLRQTDRLPELTI